MSASRLPLVTDTQDATGRLDAEAATGSDGHALLVRREDGAPDLLVRRDLLTEQPDGSYRFAASFGEVADAAASARTEGPDAGTPETVETASVPLAEETVHARTVEKETGRVRIKKRVHERTETIDEPLERQEVDVERVPVDRVLDTPASTREEDDVLVIPIMEERLVVQKQLVLKEELRVRRRRATHREPQEVTLRREEAEVDRVFVDEQPPGPSAGAAPEADAEADS